MGRIPSPAVVKCRGATGFFSDLQPGGTSGGWRGDERRVCRHCRRMLSGPGESRAAPAVHPHSLTSSGTVWRWTSFEAGGLGTSRQVITSSGRTARSTSFQPPPSSWAIPDHHVDALNRKNCVERGDRHWDMRGAEIVASWTSASPLGFDLGRLVFVLKGWLAIVSFGFELVACFGLGGISGTGILGMPVAVGACRGAIGGPLGQHRLA